MFDPYQCQCVPRTVGLAMAAYDAHSHAVPA